MIVCLLILVVFGNIIYAQKSNKQVANLKTTAYLFAYFTGNDINGESVHFAVNNDGYNFWALNNSIGVRSQIPKESIRIFGNS